MKPRLNILDVSSAIGCNLSCKGCNHFSNYFAPGSKLDTDKLLHDIKTILPRVDINRVSVIGGEPLLNPRCQEIFETCLKYASNDVYLYTNGELLEGNDWIYSHLDNPKVYLRFSFHLPESTERGAKIIKTVKDFVAKTDYELFIGPAPETDWKIRATEHHTNKDRWFYSIKKRGDKVYPYNHEKPDKSFKYCSCPNSQLYNGRLWKCPNTAFLKEMLSVTGQVGDPEWEEYNVEGVPVDCTDEELTRFCIGSIMPDNVCRMCTAKPLHFSAAQQEKTKREVINTY